MLKKNGQFSRKFAAAAVQQGAVAVLAEPGAEWNVGKIRQSEPDLGVPVIPLPWAVGADPRALRMLAHHARRRWDIVHAHDWMTFPAGIEIAKRAGAPLVVHVHSLEYDRAAHGALHRL